MKRHKSTVFGACSGLQRRRYRRAGCADVSLHSLRQRSIREQLPRRVARQVRCISSTSNTGFASRARRHHGMRERDHRAHCVFGAAICRDASGNVTTARRAGTSTAKLCARANAHTLESCRNSSSAWIERVLAAVVACRTAVRAYRCAHQALCHPRQRFNSFCPLHHGDEPRHHAQRRSEPDSAW